MKRILIISLIICSLGACTDRPVEDSEGHLNDIFHTSDPSELYFKNVRQSSYYLLPSKDQRINEFKHRKWERTNDRPQLIPHLLINTHTDRAYVMLKQNAHPNSTTPFTVKLHRADTTQVLVQKTSLEQELAIVYAIRSTLLDGGSVSIQLADGSYQELFVKGKDRSSFMTTVTDLLSLIELDRKVDRERIATYSQE